MNWIDFVRSIAEEKGIKYNEALSVASKEYHRKNGTTAKPKKEKDNSGKRLTAKQILKNIKLLVDSGEIHKGQSKKKMIEAIKSL